MNPQQTKSSPIKNATSATGRNNLTAKTYKTDLIRLAAHKSDVSINTATSVINSFLEGIAENVSSGKNVAIFGFGTFRVTTKEARTGMNPANGQPITLPATRAVSFKSSVLLKKSLKL